MSVIISSFSVTSVQNHSDLFVFVDGLAPVNVTNRKSAFERQPVDFVAHSTGERFSPAVVHELENELNLEKESPIEPQCSSNLENFNKGNWSVFFKFFKSNSDVFRGKLISIMGMSRRFPIFILMPHSSV